MRKNFKKGLSVFVILVLLMVFGTNQVFAQIPSESSTNTVPLKSTSIEPIQDTPESLGQVVNNTDTYLIVNEVISEQLSSLGSLSNVSEPKVIETNHGYAVQYEGVNEKNERALTTIIPYKIGENGDLVNSFKYLFEFNQQKQNEISPMYIVEKPSEFVDVTVTVRTYYARHFSTYHMVNFYRHSGIEAWWSSNNSTVSVSNMRVWYDTCGDLYKYPEVMNQPLSSTKIQDDYFIRSSIERSNPIEGTVYIDGSHTMPLDRVVLFTDYFKHGGLIYIRLQYSVNGNFRTDEVSYYVYGK